MTLRLEVIPDPKPMGCMASALVVQVERPAQWLT
jgi:hypothetical protein